MVFLVPVDGFIKHFSIYSTGLVLNIPPNTISASSPTNTWRDKIDELYGNRDNPTKIFSLVKLKNFGSDEEEIIGSVFIVTETFLNRLASSYLDKYQYIGAPFIEFRPNPNYLNEDKNFICSVKQGDIINIKCEYTEKIISGDDLYASEKGDLIAYPYTFVDPGRGIVNNYFLHLATLTFLFKEMSFPNISYLDPLEDKKDDD